MKTGYDQFFKNARQVAPKAEPMKFQKNSSSAKLKIDLSREDMIEQELRRRAGIKPRKKKPKSFPFKMVLFSAVGLMLALWGFEKYENVERFVKSIEISAYGSAEANETPAKPAPAQGKPDPAAVTPAAPAKPEAAAEKREPADVDPDHLQKLTERKKELDAREEELNRVEQELAVQKADLEKRMKDLEEMRKKISSVLEDRVKVDEQKIDTLVQMYSNMKPPQAAKIFESMDEDLAVEILGRMKKKNAADVMNLLKPEKAQVFSEKFAGYKRK